MSLPRMRTVTQAYAELIAIDPNTCISQNAIRQLVNTGVIPSLSIGRRKLLNLDILIEKLNDPLTLQDEVAHAYGQIRKVR